jgi:hypothetical protein
MVRCLLTFGQVGAECNKGELRIYTYICVYNICITFSIHTYKGKAHPTPGHEGPDERNVVALLPLTSGLDGEGTKPGTHRTGGCASPSAGQDRCGKFLSQ